jgi:hypothetical protein
MRRFIHFFLTPFALATAALAQTATPDQRDAKILDSIHDVMLEVEHLPWLFFAFALALLLIFGYLYQLGQKEKALRHRMAELQEMLEEHWKKKV